MEVLTVEAMFIVLNREEYLEKILQVFVDLQISGATVIESSGMGRLLAGNEPLFASFRHLLGGEERTYNKTIFSVIREPQMADLAAQRIRAILNDFREPDTGVIFSVPVTRFYSNQSTDKSI